MDYSRAVLERRSRKILITKLVLIGLPIIVISGFLFWMMIGMIMPRTGSEMYRQFFDKPATPCGLMLHHQEQGFDDCCAWMDFKTCPAEVIRILKNIEQQGLQRIDFYGEYADCSHQEPNWWIPSENMLKLRYRHSERMWTIDFYINADSSEVFCQSFSY